jgi:ribosomal protein L11 methyltransferase
LPLTDRKVLDYGCGSGILAMAAAALGATDVLGVDIDPQAISTARDNTRANALNARYAVSDDVLNDQYDVVVANILAGPLTVLAPAICAHVKSGGQLALAGILTPQMERIQNAYSPWIAMTVTDARDGWVLMTGTRS